MIEDTKIKELKKQYNDIDIPDKLEDIVNESIGKKTNKISKWVYAVATIGIIVVSINLNSSFANALEKLPLVGGLVKVVNLASYKVDDHGFDVSIKSPKIEGLTNKDLEYKLNKEFEDEGKELYNQYLNEIEQYKLEGIEGREMVKYWYEVKTDNEKTLSIALYTHHAQGSSNTEGKYYTIDKENEVVLTLEGMFGKSDYIKVISNNIKQQMADIMKNDKDKYYWLNDNLVENFESISKDQKFYINQDNKLVICFDKYEVAPGYMGVQEFIIPNDVVLSLQGK